MNTIVALVLSLVTHVSLIFGLTYSHAVVETKPASDGNKITITMQNNPNVSAADIAAKHSRLPPATTPPVHSGPFTKTLTNSAGQKFDVIASSVEEIYRSALYCPSNICDGSSSAYSVPDNDKARFYFNPLKGFQNIPSTQVPEGSDFTAAGQVKMVYNASTDTYQARVATSYSGTYGWIYFTMNVAKSECKLGYTRNLVNGKCDLTNAQAAAAAVGDGVCNTFAGMPAQGDPDCEQAIREKLLVRSVAPDGSNVSSVAAADGTVVSQKAVINEETQEVSSLLSRVRTDSTGSVREDIRFSTNGVAGTSNTTSYPTAPPGLYDGDPGGTPIPGTSQQSAAVCGSEGQPACASKIENFDQLINQVKNLNDGTGKVVTEIGNSTSTLGRGLGRVADEVSSGNAQLGGKLDKVASGQCGGPGQPVCKVTFDSGDAGDVSLPSSSDLSLSGIFDPLKSRLGSLLSFEFPAHYASCPALDVSFSAWGVSADLHNDFMCDFLERNRGLIQALVSFSYLVAAIAIILRA